MVHSLLLDLSTVMLCVLWITGLAAFRRLAEQLRRDEVHHADGGQTHHPAGLLLLSKESGMNLRRAKQIQVSLEISFKKI